MTSIDAGSAAYSHQLTNNLKLRWSTEADRAGLAMVGALAYGDAENKEDDYAVRSAERLAMDEYPTGSSTSWAICVDIAPPQEAANPLSDSPYVAKIRAKASKAKERVVAVVLLNQHLWNFEKGASTVTAGRIGLSACKVAYRGRSGLMSGLFAMIHARCASRGDVLCCVNGIPSYYNKKGYEYAVNFGKGLISHFGDLPLASDPLPPVFSPVSPSHAQESLTEMDLQAEYTTRPAWPEDAPRLLELHEMQRSSSAQWVAYKSDEMQAYTLWLSGERRGPFIDTESSHTLDLPMREPVSVLERVTSDGNRNVVAAMVIQPSKNARQITASRVLFDSTADLSKLSRELLLQTVRAVLLFWRHMQAQSQDTSETQVINGNLSSEPSSLLWYLPENNAVARHLVGQGLAVPFHQDSLLFREEWSVRIPSLSDFLLAIKDALDARLQASQHVLGTAFAFDLRIGCYNLAYAGCVIRIRQCRIEAITEQKWSAANLDRGPLGFGTVRGINVLASYQALVPLMMGYKSCREIQAAMPDLQLAPEAVVVTDILFPKSIPAFPAYL